MDIEIAEPGRMTQSGSSLLKLIQNNNMPILDLLIRESVQNSLDAAAKQNDKENFVEINFLTSEFDRQGLNRELEEVGRSLDRLYPHERYKFLAVRDRRTQGLTGNLHFDDVRNNEYGNLLKLVYEISKPQTAEGAGGSWGLGKTIYFRIGIGLVLYYSRIKTQNGYESRLAACMVEDENSRDHVIPGYGNGIRRGIAWWGKKRGANKTEPLTDEDEIAGILSVFGILPYSGDDTGTTIIIPFIDENKLLNDNTIEYRESNIQIIPYWRKDINEYLKIAAQRWYFPRINNKNYIYGPYLKVFFNSEPLGNEDLDTVFKIYRDLYNIASEKSYDLLYLKNGEFFVEPINITKSLDSGKTGNIAYLKADRKFLKMLPPENRYNPFIFLNKEIRNPEENKPIFAFTRRPGMIVSYEDTGKWVDKIPETDRNEFLLSIFVLNSDNGLKGQNISLEEYARKSELADHTSWNDFMMKGENPRIIGRIQALVSKKIAARFAVKEENQDGRSLSALGKHLGDRVLPPLGFGAKPSKPPKDGGGPKTEKSSNHKFTVYYDDIEYSDSYMIIPVSVSASRESSGGRISVVIAGDGGNTSLPDWVDKFGLEAPFSLVLSSFTDRTNKDEPFTGDVSIGPTYSKNGINIKIEHDRNGTGNSIFFAFDEKKKFNMDFKLIVRIFNPELSPVISFALEGDN